MRKNKANLAPKLGNEIDREFADMRTKKELYGHEQKGYKKSPHR
jgi:hypothetical protein